MNSSSSCFASACSLNTSRLLVFFGLLSLPLNSSAQFLSPELLADSLAKCQQRASFEVSALLLPIPEQLSRTSTYHSSSKRYHTSLSLDGPTAFMLRGRTRNASAGDSLFFLHNGLLISAFAADAKHRQQWVSPQVEGNLQLLLKAGNSNTQIVLENIIQFEKTASLAKTTDFGDAGACQVNTACSEGNGRENQVRATLRIFVQTGPVGGWASGTLINNARYDYTPYVLSAEHVGLFNQQFASANDLAQWIFYFNYQSPTCGNPTSEGSLASDFLIGAQLRARSDDEGGESGSDLLLLELLSPIPLDYDAYYAGWNLNNVPAQGGYTLHHPSGDIKKISLISGSASSGSFGTQVADTHWLVRWRPSPNGHGTTEGGSSGSALFDQNNLIVGQLTGGGSSCDATNGTDFYGKFSYNWTANGNTPDRQLKPWLDPDNTGLLALGGANFGDEKPLDTAGFVLLPNPTLGAIRISGLAQEGGPVEINLYNLGGAPVYSTSRIAFPNIDIELDLSFLKPGLYLLKLDTPQQSRTLKIVKVQ